MEEKKEGEKERGGSTKLKEEKGREVVLVGWVGFGLVGGNGQLDVQLQHWGTPPF